jgi:hypothetical protein
MGAKSIRQHVGVADIRITKHLELIAMVLAQQREKIEAEGVGAKIRRNVPDAEAPAGCALVRVRPDALCEWRRVLLAPAHVLGVNPLRIDVGIVIQGKNQIAMGARIPRIQIARVPKTGDGFVDSALRKPGTAQISMRPGKTR